MKTRIKQKQTEAESVRVTKSEQRCLKPAVSFFSSSAVVVVSSPTTARRHRACWVMSSSCPLAAERAALAQTWLLLWGMWLRGTKAEGKLHLKRQSGVSAEEESKHEYKSASAASRCWPSDWTSHTETIQTVWTIHSHTPQEVENLSWGRTLFVLSKHRSCLCTYLY